MKATLSSSNIWPPIPPIEEKIKEKTDMVDKIISKRILAGFTYTFKDVEYFFHYDQSDQQNFSLMSTSAALSLQLGNMSESDRKTNYGENLPVDLPKDWKTVWQGWKDGKSHSLEMNIPEFLDLAAAGGKHLQGLLGEGWFFKNILRSATNESELQEKVSEIDLDNMWLEYRDV